MRLLFWILFLGCFVLVGCEPGSEDENNSATNPPSSETTGSDADASQDDDENSPDSEEEPQPTIWTGPTILFEKVNFADPTLPENQDALTEKVILTRGERSALFNVVLEDDADNDSPAGTAWAEGTTEELEDLEFEPLKTAANDQMRRLPGKSFVLHLIEEDIYLDVTFLTWTSGNSAGGGFSYERTSPGED